MARQSGRITGGPTLLKEQLYQNANWEETALNSPYLLLHLLGTR